MENLQEERHKVAQELATKDGHAWETLSPELVSAYLHNADLVIREEAQSSVAMVDGKPVYTCDRCQDTAYFGGGRCLECNPMGLSVEEVHPPKELIVDIPEIIPDSTMAIGDDSALAKKEAEDKAELEAEEARKTRPLKPSEYRCSKCSKPGKTVIHMLQKSGKGIGTKHKEFTVVND